MTKTVTLGEICEKVSNCNPAADFKDSLFKYIDIASVDRLTKTVIGISEISGFEAPSRAKQIVRSGDILVSTVRPNLNAVAPVTAEYDNAIASTGFCVLRPKKGVTDSSYIFNYVRSNAFVNEMIEKATGASYPAVSDTIIKNTYIPLPALPEQRRIAALLDRADALRQKDRQLLTHYDQLAQSVFLELFGDPVRNEKGWEVKPLKQFGLIQTGNTPPRDDKENFGNYIEWIKTDNIVSDKIELIQAKEYLSEKGLKTGRSVVAGSLLVTCIAGSISSIGNAALANRKVAFNQQINAITPNHKVNSYFLYSLFKINKKVVQNGATSGMKRIITKGEFEKLEMILPPLPLQTHFAQLIEQIEQQKAVVRRQMAASEGLFGRLLQESFG
jgi:type I restriction enzyme S subunit